MCFNSHVAGLMRFAGGALLWALLPMTVVHAANTNKTRVAPAFWGNSCIVTVDRSVDPVTSLPIAIPFEDFALTEDELADSRRFQFFGLCADHPVERDMPLWVTLSDAQRSMDAGLIDALPGEDEVLDTASAWQPPGHDGQAGTCVVAINDADARMPITCGDTADGIVWDTTGIPAGNYVVRSYTFEPEKNLWARRPGLVRVVDGNDDPGPAVTLTALRRKATAYEQPGFLLSGCAAGEPGTTVRIEWAGAADVVAENESAWTLASEFAVQTGTFEALFAPPAETVYQALYLRAIATDPQGRTWIAHADHEIVVLPGCGTADGSEVAGIADGCGIVPNDYAPPAEEVVEQPSDCDYDPTDGGGLDDSGGAVDSGDAGTAGGGTETGEDGTGGSGAANGDGARCSVGGRGSALAWMLLACFGRLRRRSR